MHDIAYRRALLARLLRVTGAGSLGACLAGTLGTACSPNVSISATSAGSTGGATAGSTGHGGAPAAVASSASAGGGGGSPTTAGGGSPGDAGLCGPVQMCLPQEDAGACPTPDSLVGMQAYLTACPGTLGLCPLVETVLSGPFTDGGTECCYFVEGMPIPCYVGRTFYLDEGAVKAELRRGRGWHEGPRPEVSALPAATRRALGEAWARDGLFEHASVASFSRFSMQLLALGAPADLVRDTHAACIDEVRHTELCLALASAYFGYGVEPAGLPIVGAVEVGADLAAIAAEAALEGCVGETVAAVQAQESLWRATDPAVREVLAVTVEDETRHAELAWRFLVWALDTGGDAVREGVMRAFAGFRPAAPMAENLEGVDVALFEGHGRIVAIEARAIAERALAEVVTPCLCALLEGRRGQRGVGDGRRRADREDAVARPI
jgi:hypothetical protein